MNEYRFVGAALVAAGLSAGVQAGIHAFPTTDSWVVGSQGHLDKNRVGLFWSRERGDSVTQTFADPIDSVDRMVLKLRPGDTPVFDDPYNAGVLWRVKLNDIPVGVFAVMPGWTGQAPMEFRFDPIASPGAYTVRLEVMGTTPGSYPGHTFGTDFDTSVTLIPAPGAAALLGLGGLAAARRRRD